MIRALLGVASQSISRDGETNRLSIFNLLEDLAGEGFPLLLQTVAATFLLERAADDPAQPPARLSVRLGDARILDTAVDVDFADVLRTRVMVRVEGVVLPGPGELRFDLYVQDTHISEWVTHVRLLRPSRDPG
jgi:hypothetical protein